MSLASQAPAVGYREQVDKPGGIEKEEKPEAPEGVVVVKEEDSEFVRPRLRC